MIHWVLKFIWMSSEVLECVNGGGDEIRTHDRFNPMPAFQASALNRSATPPSIWERRKLTSLLENFKRYLNTYQLSFKTGSNRLSA